MVHGVDPCLNSRTVRQAEIRQDAIVEAGISFQTVNIRPVPDRNLNQLDRDIRFSASSAVCEKLASNDDFDIVVRQIENLEAHIFKTSVSIRLSKHCPYLVIEFLHGSRSYFFQGKEYVLLLS